METKSHMMGIDPEIHLAFEIFWDQLHNFGVSNQALHKIHGVMDQIIAADQHMQEAQRILSDAPRRQGL